MKESILLSVMPGTTDLIKNGLIVDISVKDLE
jgi:hypothetical protein